MQFILLWQSEYERNVKKQMRKEEKKMAKREREWNFPQLASIVDLNYEELRRERELVLQEAALRPILSGQKAGHTHVKPSELYPHVYDTMSDVLLSPAVLAGAKVGVERGSGGLWVCVQCVRARARVCVCMRARIHVHVHPFAPSYFPAPRSILVVLSTNSPIPFLHKQEMLFLIF